MTMRPPSIARLAAASLLVLAPALALAPAAHAQDKPAWFVPTPARPAAASPTPAASHARGPRAAPPQAIAQSAGAEPAAAEGQDDQADAAPQYNLPALAPLPPLTKTAPPPGAVIGVLGVPDVMRASTASALVQKVIGARRDKLAADYQKEQQVWRDMQQSLVNQRGTLSQDVLQSRERQLQEKVATETKSFRARNRIIQQAGQFSLAQIERVLVAVIRQVSESRGMNLVLHRQEVALNISAFDITDQVTAQLNALLPSVTIPADGEEPSLASIASVNPTAAATPAPATPTPATAAAPSR